MGPLRLSLSIMLLAFCVSANLGGIKYKMDGNGGGSSGGYSDDGGGDSGGEKEGDSGKSSEAENDSCEGECSIDGGKCTKTPVVLKCAAPPSPDCHFQTIEPKPCVEEPACEPENEYRTADGSCNSKKVPTWGMANTPYTRTAPAKYSDGKHSLPKAKDGEELPNARFVRSCLFKDKDKRSQRISHLTMVVFQLVAHDTTNGIRFEAECCDDKGKSVTSNECADISVEEDEFYKTHGRTCMKVVRIQDTHSKKCDEGPGDQLNKVTHFLDLSHTYGSDKNTADQLRTKEGGRLKTQEVDKRTYLPPLEENPEKKCEISANETHCFKAGDERVNQHPLLTSLQTIFLRAHNTISGHLAQLNPSWDDEKLYQEGRRINIAFWQHIIYWEFLSIIIGKEFAESWHLPSKEKGHITGYDKDLNPATTNNFACAVGRSAHSIIYGKPPFVDRKREEVGKYYLSDKMNKPSLIVEGENFGDLMRGVGTEAAAFDKFHDEQIVNYLLKSNKSYGDDLVAIDIQRNRDYGVASCSDFLEVIGLKKAETFEDLAQIMDEKHIEILKTIYKSVEDVDLTVCLLLERIQCDALVGLLAQRLLADAFFRWKYGDCWFYELKDCAKPFDDRQLEAIKKVTMASYMCSFGEVHEYQKEAFFKPSPENELVSCDAIPKITLESLSPWKEEPDSTKE